MSDADRVRRGQRVQRKGRVEDQSTRQKAHKPACYPFLPDFCSQISPRRLSVPLEQAGGTLADMVTMTVFITDARYGDRFTQLRKEIFGDNFPASALITVAGLARPEMLVEVQGIAVLG